MGVMAVWYRFGQWVARRAGHAGQTQSELPLSSPGEADGRADGQTGAEGVEQERRDGVRVACSDATGVVLWIEGDAGVGFDAIPVDMSVGGCRFVWPDDVTPLPEGTRLQLTFDWCVDRQVVRPGTLFLVQIGPEQSIGQVVFAPGDLPTEQAMGALITYIERINLRIRRHESPTATENLAELYRSDHAGKCPCSRC
ncbi:MAG: PilZ domain-containing protein [Magnetococcales bacterium]|nr:PilZ domain-containing protein [Magnetococcales bacterium]